jgi:hypothetical protein
MASNSEDNTKCAVAKLYKIAVFDVEVELPRADSFETKSLIAAGIPVRSISLEDCKPKFFVLDRFQVIAAHRCSQKLD